MLHRDRKQAEEVFAPDPRRSARPRSTSPAPCHFPRCKACSTRSIRRIYQWYWRADFVNELSDEAIEQHMNTRELPTLHSTMHLYPINGAVAPGRQERDALELPRGQLGEVIIGVDPDPANREIIGGRGSTGKRCTRTQPVGHTST